VSRVDELVLGLADRLADDGHTRRGFLAGVTAFLGAGTLAACGGSTEATPLRPRGAYGMDEVAVCYSPMRVVRTEAAARHAGVSGVYVRKGPSFDAEVTVGNDGTPARVPEGRHLARQSRRRAPGPGCHTPALRPELNGFVWGYPADDVASNKSGWIPVEVGGARYAGDARDYGRGLARRWLCGPHKRDFDCRSEASKVVCGYRCGGRPLGRLKRVERDRVMRDRGSRLANNNEEFYLRWALGSTPFAWVGPGDRLHEIAVRQGLSYGKCCVSWSFVEVRHSAFTPAGWRGWLLSSGLEPVGSGS
jgi:hypothetical protein